MLIVTLAIGALYLGALWIPRIMVVLIATIIAVILTHRAEQVMRRLLENSCHNLDYDRKPSRAKRRMMRASLRLAIAKTELRSLLPTVMVNAEAMVSGSARRDL